MSFNPVAARQHLHQHPELSNQEHRTHDYIVQQLTSFGLHPTTVADTGVKVTIYGQAPGNNVGYRADIDALPIHEANDCHYKSVYDGVMHACGHDVHTAVALGIAHKLSEQGVEKGSITIIFQPAEEATPVDHPVGAEKMVEEGVLQNPTLDAILALHCMPDLDVGHIGYTVGPVWAESTLVEIEIQGSSSHAAYPFEGIDAVVVAANVVNGLQTVVSRRIDARKSLVFTIGSLTAGNTYNVVADRASLLGTMRSLDLSASKDAKNAITQIVTSTANAFGATASVKFTDGARLTANNIDLENRSVAILQKFAQSYSNLHITRHPPQMASEDFAAFSSRIPGCYLFLGIRNMEKRINSPLHTPTFNVDERAIPLAVDAMTHLLQQLT